MAHWLKISEDQYINQDTITNVEFMTDGDGFWALCWLTVAVEDGEERLLVQECVLLKDDDAFTMQRYLRGNASQEYRA